MNKTGLFCGSFDPFTYGHLDVVNKAFEKVDTLIINVGDNDAKIPQFDKDKRVEMIIDALKDHPKCNCITVIAERGMTVDIALLSDTDVLIRGIRQNSSDMGQEFTLAAINKNLALVRGLKLETEFIIQEGELLRSVSSSAVKFLCEEHEFITAFKYVPDNVAEVLAETYLKSLWDECFVNNKAASDQFWQELISAYRGRAYHNLTHIAYMINMLKIYCAYIGDDLKDIRKEVLLAIFIHDIVHDTYAYDAENEKSSAKFAKKIREWSVSDIDFDMVINMVMSTSQNANVKVFPIVRDLDLAILGDFDACKWHKYCRQIRKEYKDFSDEKFNAGRLKFLQTIEKQRIFSTNFFFNKFEEQAKKNIRTEIACLQKN